MNKQPRQHNQGFALVLIIISIFMVSIIITILNRGARSLTFTANRRQANAIETNLQKSAQAWIAQNQQEGGGNPGLIILDINKLTSRPATLRIQPQDPNRSQSILTIETQCTYEKHQNRQTITITSQ